jgi:UDP-glucose 4-epimerase
MSGLRGRRVLVTGGTGQIGSFLVERLVREGCEVTVIGRNPDRYEEITKLILNEKISFLRCDITRKSDVAGIKNELKHMEYLAHFSSATEPRSQNFFENARYDIDLNIGGTVFLLGAMKNLDGICLASSMAVYGAPGYNPVDEKCPTEPLSTYGVSKLTAEKLLEIHSHKAGIPLSILRYSSVYGDRNLSHRAMPTFISNALTDKDLIIKRDGSVIRDYIHVSDAVDAATCAIMRNSDGIFNIGYGKGCSIGTLAKMILKLVHSRSKMMYVRAPRDFDFVYNLSKARKELGYKPKVGLRDGLPDEIAWRKSLTETPKIK